MFGKVRNINENSITLENITHEVHSELMGCHVVFDEAERKIVGEITKLTSEEAEILLVGEIQGNRFSPGALRKPTSVPRIITKGELELVIGAQVDSKNTLLLGGSNVYKDFRISVNVNDIFANHFAIIGNSGSGKSCGVTRMLQNLFLKADKPVNSHFVLFDAYGEYKNAFSFMNESGLGFKRITFDGQFIENDVRNTWERIKDLVVNDKLEDVVVLDKHGQPRKNRSGNIMSAPNFPKSSEGNVFVRGTSSTSDVKPLTLNGIKMYNQQIWVKGLYIVEKLDSEDYI